MTEPVGLEATTSSSPANINDSGTIHGGYRRSGRKVRKSGRKGRKTGRKVRKTGRKGRKSRKSRR